VETGGPEVFRVFRSIKAVGELMKNKPEIDSQGHQIAQALFGPPMLEAEAKVDQVKSAFHESGHAVLGYLLSQGIQWMWIETRESDHPDWYRGMTLFNTETFLDIEAGREQNTTKRISLIKKLILIYFAGLVAESIHRDPTDREPLASRYKAGKCSKQEARSFTDENGDYARIERCIPFITGDPQEGEALIVELENQCRNMLMEESNWRKVESLAKALLKQPTTGGKRILLGHQVMEIFEKPPNGLSLVESARHTLDSAVPGNTPAILQCGGGKDSLAILSLCKDKNITVHFVDTGAALPHMNKFIMDACKKFNVPLEIIRPPIPVQAHTELYGYPSDIVPSEFSPEHAFLWQAPPETKIQSRLQCCSALRWQPLQTAIMNSRITTVIRGYRNTDRYRTQGSRVVIENGIKYVAPLYDWTDQDVFEYLEKEGVGLPEQYGTTDNSLDCWLCTAFSTNKGSENDFKYIREHYPELWPELASRVRRVKDAVEKEKNKMDLVFNLALKPDSIPC